MSRPSPSRAKLAVAMSALLALLVAAPATASEESRAGAVDYRLPFEAGVEILVSQGWLGTYSHAGLAAYAYDFVLPEGTPVLASADGRVSYAHAGEAGCGGSDALGLANYVTIDHADGTATHYGHLAGVAVVAGQDVAAGQVIGSLGRTGFTNCDPHLHFARQAQGGPVTQSMPVYFAEYPGLELLAGQVVVGGLVLLAAAVPIEIEHLVEIELRTEVTMRQAVRERVQAVRSFDPRPSAWGLGPVVVEAPPHPSGPLEAP